MNIRSEIRNRGHELLPLMRKSLLFSLVVIALFAVAAPAAETRTTVFDIRGMHCSGCAEGIESMVRRIDGVIRVEASYEKREARVEFDPARTSNEKIIETIEKLGYHASPKNH